MKEQITICEANLADPKQSADLLNMLRQYAMDLMGGGTDLSEHVKQNLILELRKRNGLLALLAYDGETPVGLCIGFEGFSTFYAKPLINIHDFVVVQNYRGRGIAKLLLEKTETIAKERNCCKLTLEVLEGNSTAQKVYKAFGFAGYELDPVMGKALFLDKKI